jgi:hypothetical protein
MKPLRKLPALLLVAGALAALAPAAAEAGVGSRGYPIETGVAVECIRNG